MWGVGGCGLPCTGPTHYSAHRLKTEEDSKSHVQYTLLIICIPGGVTKRLGCPALR